MNSIPEMNSAFYQASLPILLLIFGSLVAMLQSVSRTMSGEKAVGMTLALFPVAAFVSLMFFRVRETSFLGGALLSDAFSIFAQMIILAAGLFVAFMSWLTWIRPFFFRGEVACLFQMVLTGMLVMVASEDLISIFIGLELSSIGIYAMLGYLFPDRQSQEGAIKYFILGSFATAILLFGFGMLYAGTGSLNLTEIFGQFSRVDARSGPRLWASIGAVFTLSGFAFKFALAPFHLWSPDAYESAPTSMTGLMATCVKIMVMVVMLRFYSKGMEIFQSPWGQGLMILAVLSMFAGNILALVQTSIKRLLAYSSIAHGGYMAIALSSYGSGNNLSVHSILFYVIIYALASLTAFGVLMALESQERRNLTLDDLKGIGTRYPWYSFCLTVAIFSMAGLPPTAGFFGKFFIFNAALREGSYGMVVSAALASVIGLYYYLRLVVFMYFKPADEELQMTHKLSPVLGCALGLLLSITLLLGTIFPGTLMEYFKTQKLLPEVPTSLTFRDR